MLPTMGDQVLASYGLPGLEHDVGLRKLALGAIARLHARLLRSSGGRPVGLRVKLAECKAAVLDDQCDAVGMPGGRLGQNVGESGGHDLDPRSPHCRTMPQKTTAELDAAQ